MGRIKTQLVKRNSLKIFKGFPKRFTADFTANKQAIGEILQNPNKKLRNVIAGYITRLAKQEKE